MSRKSRARPPVAPVIRAKSALPSAASRWRATALIATAALAMQTVVWTALYDVFGILRLGYGFFDISDVPHYFVNFASRMADGLVPYRDFFVEYPPLFVPLLVAAGLDADQATFSVRFAGLMATLVAFACVLTALTASREEEDAESARPYVVAAVSSVFTLLLGPIAANRYDAAVALVVALVVLLMAAGRWSAVAAMIGIGFALKVTPAMLLPLALLVAPANRIRGMAVAFTLTAAAPFAMVLTLGGDATENLGRMFVYHLGRPLEIESVLATPFWIAKLAGILDIKVGLAAGSQVIVSATADAVAKVSSVLLLAALGSVLALVWRRREAVRADTSLQALVVLATLLASFVGSKVLSPQYFVWIIPVAALVAVERRLLGALVVAALVLTHLLFPANYWLFARSQAPAAIAIVVVRNFVVVAAYALALWSLWSLPAPRASRAADAPS